MKLDLRLPNRQYPTLSELVRKLLVHDMLVNAMRFNGLSRVRFTFFFYLGSCSSTISDFAV